MPATSIFTRVVRPGHESEYEEWLSGISRASSGFTGSHGTTILKPGDGRKAYVAIVQFDTQQHLDGWLESGERQAWMDRLDSIDICSQNLTSLAGMERWFTPAGASDDQMPPRYKTATLILLGLYPLVLLLELLLNPLLEGLPGPVRVLLSLIVSVALMVWVVLPGLTQLFSGWLHPRRTVRGN